MGARAAIRSGTEIQALGFHQHSSREYFKKLTGGPLTEALDARDGKFGDYRTGKKSGA
jgi:enoyl-CoA hydratase